MVTEGPSGLPSGLAPGSRLAGYRLQEQIGRGGMSVVFAALDEHLGRQVALKVLAPELATDVAFRERFVRESRAAAAVDSPHIIPVYEAGEAAGVLFISMRLVRGGDAKSLVERYGPQPPGRVAEIISQVASALDAAHQRGLVHRDVKPANMLLAEPGQLADRDHVYLSDFGLTKASLQASGLTAAGQFMGTLNYVAPEQILGRPVDGRADQYALACSAFELLTGQPPFARDEPTAVMYAQLNEPPPALSALRPTLPPGLDMVFARALAKQPQDRYTSCREFSAALRQVVGVTRSFITRTWSPRGISEGPVSAPTAVRPGPGAGLPAPTRSTFRAAAVAALALVVLAGLGGGVAFWSLRHRPQPGRDRPPAAGPRLPAVSVAAPGCSGDTGLARFRHLRPAGVLSVPAPPYGAVVTANDRYTFVALPHSIEVFGNQGGVPAGAPIRRIAVPDHPHAQLLTSDNAYLVTATDHGALVIRTAAAEGGRGRAAAGLLPSDLPGNPGGDDLALSSDGRYVFEAMRWANKIAIFDLARALRSGFGPADLVGYLRTGDLPHGMLVSADGRWLYLANRFARPGTLQGSLSVYSVRAAETDPAQARARSVIVGCGAYRVIGSPDGSVLWVLAQASDTLVGVSAARLRTDPRHAIVAAVRVGPVPLDEVLVNGGSRLLVTDNSGASVAIVDPAAALAHRSHALLGYVRTPALPRFFAYVPDAPDVLLVTGGSSGQIRALRIDQLP